MEVDQVLVLLDIGSRYLDLNGSGDGHFGTSFSLFAVTLRQSQDVV